jgi:hypothetical protein
MNDFAPTSPHLPVNDGIVKTRKAFSDGLTLDLTDDEICKAFEIILPIRKKWEERFRMHCNDPINFTAEEAVELIDHMEDEIKYELATRLDIYTEMDCTPIFEGKPPIIEFVGALPSHSIAKYGFDHEKKTYEVQKARERGEDYLGQKGK